MFHFTYIALFIDIDIKISVIDTFIYRYHDIAGHEQNK
jgi:hypothetical protein